ncbi:MAG: antibiotic biosynthesis monooxygenase [Kangiellaceae bacterium]|nr:antibiotic biosynthesis monooxygenase [Kangiellaceae bacterium]
MTQANLGLLVRIKAKPGKEVAVEEFLRQAVSLAKDEDGTTSWFAIKFSSDVFGIFDTFENAEGRSAHAKGKISLSLRGAAKELLREPPTIEPIEVLACKL